MKLFLWCLVLCWAFVPFLSAQESERSLIQSFLDQQATNQAWAQADVAQWAISSAHTSAPSGIRYVYLQQTHQGIPVANGTATIAIKDGAVRSMGDRLLIGLHDRAPGAVPARTPEQAILAAAKALQLPKPQDLVLEKHLASQHFQYNAPQLSPKSIPVELVYYQTDEGVLHLAWDLSLYQNDGQHWWSVKIDAQTGALIHQVDWMLQCSFGHTQTGTSCTHTHPAPEQLQQPDQYTVYALPVESPLHGSRSVVTNPADPLASPYGWHDHDGVAGAEFTTTRGNNVYAYPDTNNSGVPIPSILPNGGSALEFNFPIPANGSPRSYRDAAMTNLFYLNNMMHDIWYHYGFDEASGNFQHNNYGNGGIAADPVRAEGQDGGSFNNANMATPPDGTPPVMQMYLWKIPLPYLTVASPNNISGPYQSLLGEFGPALSTTPITGDLVLVEDIQAPLHDGCDSIVNAAQLTGQIALVEVGLCSPAQQALQAERSGALAVIFIHNGPQFPPDFYDYTSSTSNIPCIMVGQDDGNRLKAALAQGPVQVSLTAPNRSNIVDSDFDNGIIAHEYGHGITIRLVGGASAVNCLFNREQMGEGWSDWFGLMLTIAPGDQGSDGRGIGNYSLGNTITDNGVRPAPYSTDFAINAYTYGNTNDGDLLAPHGLGFIYATVLWDLTWALIDRYGGIPDPDLHYGTGGNNIAMQLLIESLKLLPCSPGMIDGRNSMLLADELLYGGTHKCLIWETFARRGFGFSANQGLVTNRFDQVEAFDIPPSCTATSLPIAQFITIVEDCPAIVQFKNASIAPYQSLWIFGDGDTARTHHATHQYRQSGTYTVQLWVTNDLGQDSSSITVTVEAIPPATIKQRRILSCLGEPHTLVANGSGTVHWLDDQQRLVGVGDSLLVVGARDTQFFYAKNAIIAPSQYIGPVDTSIGPTHLDNSNATGILNFITEQALELVSFYVLVDQAGPRTFYIARNFDFWGIPPAPQYMIVEKTIHLQAGWQRVEINLSIPEAGGYHLGCNQAGLIHNRYGNFFPYSLPGYMTLNSSNGPFDNVYFYNLEIKKPACTSIADTAVLVPTNNTFEYTSNLSRRHFTSTTPHATSWEWDFGDQTTSKLQNPIHTYQALGTYTVTLTINGGACTYSKRITISSLSDDLPTIWLVPNPTQQTTLLQLAQAAPEDTQVILYNSIGQRVQTHSLPKGDQQLQLTVEELPAGVYWVTLYGKTLRYALPLVVE